MLDEAAAATVPIDENLFTEDDDLDELEESLEDLDLDK